MGWSQSCSKQIYFEIELICTPIRKELANTSRCLVEKREGYIQLIARMRRIAIVRLVPERRKEIYRFFGVPKDENKQHLILDAWSTNLHFI